MRGHDSRTAPRPDVRLEAQPLQDSGRARGAAALNLIGGILGGLIYNGLFAKED